MYRHLEERSLFEEAGAYSLLAEHFSTWYADQQKWVTPLLKAWVNDPEYGAANTEVLGRMVQHWLPQASAAVGKVAAKIEENLVRDGAVSAADKYRVEVTRRYADLGIPVAG